MATDFDFVIWDSTPSGLMAGIAAARAGLSVAVVTEDRHIGGLQTSGLGWTNAGQRQLTSGLAREFLDRVKAYYVGKYGEDSEQVEVCSDGFHWEPHVAEAIYEGWAKESGLTILRETPIVSVRKNGATIEAVQTEQGEWITGKVFLDASYEGDLLALADIECHTGRESRETYGESLAGVRWPPEREGEEDAALQPMDYRLCLTNDPDNRVPFTRPDDYDASRYAWHRGKLLAQPPQRLHTALPLNPMPNRKTDSRTGEWVGASWDYPFVSRQRRREIDRAHRHYSAGYIWFLLTENVLPKPLLEELEQWGHAADEFTDNDHWPWHIYVREARRMVGSYVMTQHDVLPHRHKPDGIALGSFYIDVHPVQMLPDPTGEAPRSFAGLTPEGHLGNVPVQPYDIPFRTLLPKREQATNLLASICISCSHVAFATIRMEPVYQMLGHAAGLTAVMAIAENEPVQEVNPLGVRDLLAAQGQIVSSKGFDTWWPRKPEGVD